MAKVGTDPASIENEVRRFVVMNFLYGRGGDSLRGDESFMALGVLDSTGVMELVAFVEQTWGIQMADEELGPENLDSVNALVGYVVRKLRP